MQVESVRKGCISFQKDGKSFKRERISFAKLKSTIMREEQIDSKRDRQGLQNSRRKI